MNHTGTQKTTVSHRILKPDGNVLAEKETFTAQAGQKVDFSQTINNIRGQQLWSPDDPIYIGLFRL